VERRGEKADQNACSRLDLVALSVPLDFVIDQKVCQNSNEVWKMVEDDNDRVIDDKHTDDRDRDGA
jgi:hypothetical protein